MKAFAYICAVALVALCGCGHGKTSGDNGTVTKTVTSTPSAGESDKIAGVVAVLGCNGYQRDEVIAPGSIESGSCTLSDGTDVQLYLMPSRAAGKSLEDLAHTNGVTDVEWLGNVLVVES
jgi:hypothetical protein